MFTSRSATPFPLAALTQTSASAHPRSRWRRLLRRLENSPRTSTGTPGSLAGTLPPGNLCHESTGLGNFDANPRVKLLPKAKSRPLDTSGLSRRNPRAKVDPSSSTLIRQGAQYVASVTEESVLAPSPTSAGAAHSQTDPLGRCNFNNPPLPTMFDAQVHESSQITQLETYVLPRHEVSLWRDLSACTPVCPSGHALNRIQLVDFLTYFSQARLAAAAPRASALTASPLPVSGVSLLIF